MDVASSDFGTAIPQRLAIVPASPLLAWARSHARHYRAQCREPIDPSYIPPSLPECLGRGFSEVYLDPVLHRAAYAVLGAERLRVRIGPRIVQASDSGRGVRVMPLLLFVAVVVLVVAGLVALMYLAARYWL